MFYQHHQAFRNNKSLKDKLVRSKLKNPNRRDSGNYKCGSNLCQICNIISLENEFTDTEAKLTKLILILIVTVNV